MDDLPDLNALILDNQTWLHRRCLSQAARLAGVQGDDLFQDVVLRFLDRAAAGWFDGPVQVSVQARARTLFNNCLRQAATQRIRQGKRVGSLEGPDGQPQDPGEQPAPRPWEPQQDLLLEQTLGQGPALTSPPRWLSLLSRDLPRAVRLGPIQRARAYRRGGSRMVLRPAAEAHQHLHNQRQDAALVGDPSRWKPVLGAIYFGEGPLDAVPPQVRKAGASKIERYANRALDDLHRHLTSQEGGA